MRTICFTFILICFLALIFNRLFSCLISGMKYIQYNAKAESKMKPFKEKQK